MPIYEYACAHCGKLNEVIQKVNDPVPAVCDGCGATGGLSKVVSRSSFVLKGGGWYSDLYSSTNKNGAGKASSSSEASSSAASASSDKSSASSPPASGSSTSSSSTSTDSSSKS